MHAIAPHPDVAVAVELLGIGKTELNGFFAVFVERFAGFGLTV